MENLYGVKIIYKHTVKDEENTVFFEEQILTVTANSFDEAYQLAEKYAKESCDEHTNPDGQSVRCEIYKIADCFLAFDEENNIKEVYSMITKNKTKISDEEFADILTNCCDKEEMYALRYGEFNKKEG